MVLEGEEAAGDNGMPTHGVRWAQVSAEGTHAVTPPSDPGAGGLPPSGRAGLSQRFRFDPGAPHLVFDAAFLLNGALESFASNDFMSVDVSDGVLTHNLYYAD